MAKYFNQSLLFAWRSTEGIMYNLAEYSVWGSICLNFMMVTFHILLANEHVITPSKLCDVAKQYLYPWCRYVKTVDWTEKGNSDQFSHRVTYD